jgi:glucose-1-phosphate cytidylyltransferase
MIGSERVVTDGESAVKVVLLAGGLGTRLSEETTLRPKPLVEIGGRPILWHIMKIFSAQGFQEFIICTGYKGFMIKEYFAGLTIRESNVLIDMRSGRMTLEAREIDPWIVRIVDTGDETMTGGRIKRVLKYLGDDPEFLMTYGDGVANIDLAALLAMHKAGGRKATVTGARPPARFGELHLDGDAVTDFLEKVPGEGSWINGGFFVLPRDIGDYIEGDATTFEQEPLKRLSGEGQLSIYRHDDFWLPMDSLRDKNALEAYWRTSKAPWKIW